MPPSKKKAATAAPAETPMRSLLTVGPTLAVSGVSLGVDASSCVWAQVLANADTANAAMCICKSWKEFVSRSCEGALQLDSLSQLSSILPFTGARTLNARDVQWLTDTELRSIATSTTMLPSLTRIDVSGCQKISSRRWSGGAT